MNARRTRQEYFESILEDLPICPESSCSYFPEKRSRFKAFHSDETLADEMFEVALAIGFRRCGEIYYKTSCRHCHLCLPYRVPVADFKPTRSQRRVLKRNEDVLITVDVPKATSEKEAMYLRYQASQHGEGAIQDRGADLVDTMYTQMYTNPTTTREMELYLDEKLIGFGIIDLANHVVSAVYNVFEPEYGDRSLGTLMILRTLEWANNNRFAYYNLGYMIPGHPKMDYKRRFGPAEGLNPFTGEWEEISSILAQRDMLESPAGSDIDPE
jgi:arginine-tRNA-protein transferase